MGIQETSKNNRKYSLRINVKLRRFLCNVPKILLEYVKEKKKELTKLGSGSDDYEEVKRKLSSLIENIERNLGNKENDQLIIDFLSMANILIDLLKEYKEYSSIYLIKDVISTIKTGFLDKQTYDTMIGKLVSFTRNRIEEHIKNFLDEKKKDIFLEIAFEYYYLKRLTKLIPNNKLELTFGEYLQRNNDLKELEAEISGKINLLEKEIEKQLEKKERHGEQQKNVLSIQISNESIRKIIQEEIVKKYGSREDLIKGVSKEVQATIKDAINPINRNIDTIIGEIRKQMKETTTDLSSKINSIDNYYRNLLSALLYSSCNIDINSINMDMYIKNIEDQILCGLCNVTYNNLKNSIVFSNIKGAINVEHIKKMLTNIYQNIAHYNSSSSFYEKVYVLLKAVEAYFIYNDIYQGNYNRNIDVEKIYQKIEDKVWDIFNKNIRNYIVSGGTNKNIKDVIIEFKNNIMKKINEDIKNCIDKSIIQEKLEKITLDQETVF